ncbi:hypothetical protein, partial [Nocardia cyriacigeorgica]|uniref:hypothetical protein n=1 Tax=Nocardia cyriacigeorgica TaxID=135487 RepID=UPI001893C498
GDPAPASLPDHPDAPAPAGSAGPLGVLALARLLADTAWQLGLRASAVATGELSTVLSCDNQLTELGMHDAQRYSCYSCRDWADHAHDWPVPARRTLTAHAAALATTYGTSPAAPVGPQVWIAVSQNHFHSGFLSP